MKQISIVIAIAAATVSGCGSDRRLADLAQQVTHEQAAQNQRIAESTQTVAKGSQELVTADAQARKDMINLQHALREDQARIGEQLTALEAERKDVAEQRLYDSAIGNGLGALSLVCVAIAPLLLAAISLVGLWRSPTQEEEGHILIEELSNELLERSLQHPRLPPQLEHSDDSSAPRM